MWAEIVKQVAIHAALAFIKPRLKVRRKVHPLWYNIALKERGVIELPGPRHNPRILEYHRASNGNFDSDEIPWCASFVNWCLHSSRN